MEWIDAYAILLAERLEKRIQLLAEKGIFLSLDVQDNDLKTMNDNQFNAILNDSR